MAVYQNRRQFLTEGWPAPGSPWPRNLGGGGTENELPRVSNLAVGGGLLLFLLAWSYGWATLEADRSLHPDVLEAYAWGKEFQLGYDKHGPFWAWIAGAWFLLFPKTNSSFVLLEALNATLGLWGAWRLIGLFANGWTRHAAALLLLATPFYTFQAYKYNANTIFLSLWPWTMFFFVKSIDNMKMRDAALFGVLAAACILSKYYAVVMLATCALSLAFHPNGRRYILSPLPWIAGAAFSVLILPHLIWTLKAGSPAVTYAVSKGGKGWLFSVLHAARFLLYALLSQGGVIAIIVLACRARKDKTICQPGGRLSPWRRQFLAVLVLAPPILTVLFGLAFQLRIDVIMAAGTFSLMPLFLMTEMGPLDSWRCFRLAGAVAAAVTVATLAGAPYARTVTAQKRNGPSMTEPRQELAARVTELWHAETNAPLRYAGGAARYANAISFYSEDHPSSFVNLDYASALWLTPAKLQQNGLLIACEHQDAACLSKAAGHLSGNWKQTSISICRKIGTRAFPKFEYDIFIIPPRAA